MPNATASISNNPGTNTASNSPAPKNSQVSAYFSSKLLFRIKLTIATKPIHKMKITAIRTFQVIILSAYPLSMLPLK